MSPPSDPQLASNIVDRDKVQQDFKQAKTHNCVISRIQYIVEKSDNLYIPGKALTDSMTANAHPPPLVLLALSSTDPKSLLIIQIAILSLRRCFITPKEAFRSRHSLLCHTPQLMPSLLRKFEYHYPDHSLTLCRCTNLLTVSKIVTNRTTTTQVTL